MMMESKNTEPATQTTQEEYRKRKNDSHTQGCVTNKQEEEEEEEATAKSSSLQKKEEEEASRLVPVPRECVPAEFAASPFLDLDAPVTAFEVVVGLVMLPLLPLRILLVCTGVLAWAMLASVAMIWLPKSATDDDDGGGLQLSTWRFHVSELASFPNYLILLGLGFTINVSGWENYTKLRHRARELGPVIALFNHVSYVDAIVLMALFAPSGVSRIENKTDIPIVGPCLAAFDPIYVDLDSKKKKDDMGTEDREEGTKKATKEDITASQKSGHNNNNNNNTDIGNSSTPAPHDHRKDLVARKIDERVKSEHYMRKYGQSNVRLLFIAPEGSTHKSDTILPFRRGAFVPGVAVLPVCLKYRRNRRDTRATSTTTSGGGGKFAFLTSYFNPAWTVNNLLLHALRMMLQFRSHIDVSILDVYEPSDAERYNPDEYAQRLSGVYSKELGLDVAARFTSVAEARSLIRSGVSVTADGASLLLPAEVVHGDAADGSVVVDKDAFARIMRGDFIQRSRNSTKKKKKKTV